MGSTIDDDITIYLPLFFNYCNVVNKTGQPSYKNRLIFKHQGADSQNFLSKLVRFFVTLSLKILRLK